MPAPGLISNPLRSTRTRPVLVGASLVLVASLAGLLGRQPPMAAAAAGPSPLAASPAPSSTPTATPPATPTPMVIGTSVAGRPLEVFRFGEGPSRRMIVAGIHGGYEWNTIALGEELVTFLSEKPGVVPEERTLFILRALNPDGEARSNGFEGRANESGVDLNRNWPVDWRPGWPPAGCWNFLPISPGPHPVSEPETSSLMRFVYDAEIDALISLHSAGLGIFPGGTPPEPASARLAEAIAAIAPYPYPPIDTGCMYTGTLPDWAAASGIPSLDLELSTHWGTDFEIGVRVLEVFLGWDP